MEERELKIEYVDIDSITPSDRNAKQHPAKQIKQIKKSIQDYGMNDPIGVWHDEIVEGHGRVIACKELGIDKVPIIRLDGLTDEQRREYMLVHNKTTMNSDFDVDILNMELEDLPDFDAEFYDFELEIDDDEPQQIVEDEVPEEVETRCKLGDLWQLWGHRLICGDSTDVAVIDRLMDGVKADCVFTDPPYNVAIGSKNAVLNEMNHAKRGHRVETEIAGDKGLTDAEIGEQLWRPAFQNMADYAKDDCSIYVTMPQGGTHMMMMMMMADAGWQVKHELMWLKNQPTFSMGRLDYDYKHEPIMYGWKKTHNFYGKGKFTKSVWEIDKPRESKLHPTMKPIELIANALENSTKENDCVLDVFGGSGSTLIACEQLNRKCYMCELDERYCDVIVQRWENFTGKKAIKVEG